MRKTAFVGLSLVLTAVGGCAGTPDEYDAQKATTVAEFVGGLSGPDARSDPARQDRIHQFRNMDVMVELVSALPPRTRPKTVVYLASGDHLAPIGLCELLANGEPCTLIYTEIDSAVQAGITQGIQELEGEQILRVVEAGPEIQSAAGQRRWILESGGRRIVLELRITDPGGADGGGLLTPALLSEAGLVISHDWSGEPVGNLQVISEFVRAARHGDDAPPLLMIEDLRNHLFPVDLTPFGVRAAASGPFGHRGSDHGPGRHGLVELGPPIFGGGVLLDFRDQWWRDIDESTLLRFFDFLIFNEFDIDRRNVLTGGDQPIVAPVLLDWWTGYGERGIDGERFEKGNEFRASMLSAAAGVAAVAGPHIRERIACRLNLYATWLAIRAKGSDTLDLMPSPNPPPDQTALVSPEMEKLFRQALRRAGEFRTEREEFGPEAADLLEFFDSELVAPILAECPLARPELSNELSADEIREEYLRIRDWLALF